MRVVLSTVVLHLKRGDMKGKTERVSSAKVIKNTQKRKRLLKNKNIFPFPFFHQMMPTV
jgi:hypothetical protein